MGSWLETPWWVIWGRQLEWWVGGDTPWWGSNQRSGVSETFQLSSHGGEDCWVTLSVKPMSYNLCSALTVSFRLVLSDWMTCWVSSHSFVTLADGSKREQRMVWGQCFFLVHAMASTMCNPHILWGGGIGCNQMSAREQRWETRPAVQRAGKLVGQMQVLSWQLGPAVQYS